MSIWKMALVGALAAGCARASGDGAVAASPSAVATCVAPANGVHYSLCGGVSGQLLAGRAPVYGLQGAFGAAQTGSAQRFIVKGGSFHAAQ